MPRNEREELIKQIMKFISGPGYNVDIKGLENFILEDRKRIVEPLIKWKEQMNNVGKWPDPVEAIDETLKLAGVQE